MPPEALFLCRVEFLFFSYFSDFLNNLLFMSGSSDKTEGYFLVTLSELSASCFIVTRFWSVLHPVGCLVTLSCPFPSGCLFCDTL